MTTDAAAGLEVRDFVAADHPQVVALLAANLSPFEPGTEELPVIVSAFLEQAHVEAVVAVSSVRIAGCAFLFINETVRGGRIGQIEDVAVDMNCRGTGVGRAMIAQLVDRAKARGCYKIILACSSNNVAFYQKAGFTADGTSMSILIRS